MEVLEAGEVTADDDQVHAALVLDVVVAHGLAALVEDAEGEALLAAAAELGREDLELQPGVVRDGEAVDLRGAVVRAVPGTAVGAAGHRLGGLLAPGGGIEGAAGGRGGDEEHGEQGAEGDEAGRDAHATTS